MTPRFSLLKKKSQLSGLCPCGLTEFGSSGLCSGTGSTQTLGAEGGKGARRSWEGLVLSCVYYREMRVEILAHL